MVETIEHAGLLAQGWTDTTSELGEGIGAVKQLVSQLPVAFIEGVVPLRGFVTQWTSPVAERHATVHAARCLQLTFAGVKRLLHLAKVVDSIVNRTVARLLAVYL